MKGALLVVGAAEANLELMSHTNIFTPSWTVVGGAFAGEGGAGEGAGEGGVNGRVGEGGAGEGAGQGGPGEGTGEGRMQVQEQENILV